MEVNHQIVNSPETEAQLPRFLDHQWLSSLGDLIQSVLANTPLGYNNILGGGGSREGALSCPSPHVRIASGPGASADVGRRDRT